MIAHGQRDVGVLECLASAGAPWPGASPGFAPAGIHVRSYSLKFRYARVRAARGAGDQERPVPLPPFDPAGLCGHCGSAARTTTASKGPGF